MPSEVLHACEISCLDIKALAFCISRFLPVKFDSFSVTQSSTILITSEEFTDGDLSPYSLVWVIGTCHFS